MFDSKMIKKRIIPTVIMIAAGAVIYIGSAFYNPAPAESVAAGSSDVVMEADNSETDETPGAKRLVYTVEENWTPSPDEFNLAHIFPEGSDTDEESESYGTKAFNALVRHESSWWSQVYSSASLTPAQLAVQLGRDVSSVYSSSGEVKSFKSIHMNVVNGDGTPVNMKSNIIEIMSMANVYTFYHDMEDYDGFLEYCEDLFDRSHSYSVSMSSVYYCDGSCQNSSIDSEEFDEDFFTYDTNFNIDTESTEPLDYFYEPVYQTDESGSNVIITGDALEAYENSPDNFDIRPSSDDDNILDEDFYYDYEEDEVTVNTQEDTTAEETARETRSSVWTAEEETENFSEEEAAARAASEAQSLAESQAEAEAQALAEAQSAAESEAMAQAQALAEAQSLAESQALAEAQAQMGILPETEEVIEETESQAPVIHAGISNTTEAQDEEEISDDGEWEAADVYASEIVEYYDTASSSDAEPSEDESVVSSSSSSSTRTTARCPGHVDLTINIRIYDLDGEKNLYTIDATGSKTETVKAEEVSEKSEDESEDDQAEEEIDKEDTDNETEEDDSADERIIWPGWDAEMRGYVMILSSKDWYEEYGLSLSTFSFGNPLTPSEISRYMAMLPEDLSETRKKVIEFALESVGKVPYYWGGKASHAGYEGNNFGMLIDPDHSGRVLKGLDCSGWVNWVYWSVTGEYSPNDSTSSLCSMGEAITLNQMQPGDIAVRTGSSAHVIMFLGWAEDGNILCIHESSAGVNNVTIAERAPSWPYYRSIFD